MILEKHDRIITSEGRNVILFLNYTLCHPETIQAHLTNIKPIFSPKIMTSWFQPFYTVIIRMFKLIYHKLHIEFVISRIESRNMATEIINEVNVLKAIDWLHTASEQVSDQCIQICFKKCGFKVPIPHVSNLDDNSSIYIQRTRTNKEKKRKLRLKFFLCFMHLKQNLDLNAALLLSFKRPVAIFFVF